MTQINSGVSKKYLMTEGNLFIVSAPSGAGKSSLVHHALKTIDNLCYSISYTTRQPRGLEQNGKDYYFVSQDVFKFMRENGEFLECAEVHGNYYGTHQATTDKIIKSGKDVILDIDVQGAAQIKEKMPKAISIFILPPSPEILESRLRARAENTEADIERRLKNARDEIKHCKDYQFVIVNDEFGNACRALEAIIRAERQVLSRQLDKTELIIKSFGG
ncbi:MAG: guanylate kinase [Acidobacteriota bacterium]